MESHYCDEDADSEQPNRVTQINNFIRGRHYAIYVVYLNLFLFSISYFVYMWSYESIIEELDGDLVVLNFLTTAGGFLMIICAPLLGHLGDVYGQHLLMLIGYSATLLTFIFTYVARKPLILYLSRLPSVFLYPTLGAEMALMDFSCLDHKLKVLAFGRFWSALGCYFGYLLGRSLQTQYGSHLPILFSITLICICCIILFVNIPSFSKLPPNVQPPRRFEYRRIITKILDQRTSILLMIQLVLGVPLYILQDVLPIIAIDSYALSVDSAKSWILNKGLLPLPVTGFLLPYLISNLRPDLLLKGSVFVSLICYMCLLQIENIYHLAAACLILIWAITCAKITCVCIFVLLSDPADSGMTLGLCLTTELITYIYSPLIMDLFVDDIFTISFVSYAGTLSSAMILCLIIFTIHNLNDEV